eukprot:12655023-Alexandrium_andersonii.AAC.1
MDIDHRAALMTDHFPRLLQVAITLAGKRPEGKMRLALKGVEQESIERSGSQLDSLLEENPERELEGAMQELSLIHISEPTRLALI